MHADLNEDLTKYIKNTKPADRTIKHMDLWHKGLTHINWYYMYCIQSVLVFIEPYMYTIHIYI